MKKRNFLGIKDDETPSNDIDDKIKEGEKKRILSMKNSMSNNSKMSDEIDKLTDMMNKMSETSIDQDKEENIILDTVNDKILLQKYEKEQEEKFNISTKSVKKILLKERQRLINNELSVISVGIKKDIQIHRKLINEKEKLEKEWSVLNKYKNKPELLKKNIEKHMKRRKEILEEYKNMGVDPDEHDKASLEMAEKIWKDINDTIKENYNKWNEMNEKQKLDPFIDKYPDFSKSYQLVLKYMIFNLQYNSNAFKRFLERCRKNIPSATAKHAEIQDIRFQNQASYVLYLYEEYQNSKNQHINKKTSQRLFDETLKNLRKEKKEFEKKYKEAKNKIESEKIEQGKEVLSNLVTQIKSGKDLNDDDQFDAIELLNAILGMQKQQQDDIDNTTKDCIKGFTKLAGF